MIEANVNRVTETKKDSWSVGLEWDTVIEATGNRDTETNMTVERYEHDEINDRGKCQ